MIVHESGGGRELHTNKTTDRQPPASVEVEESGTYQVTIFAIRGEKGIMDSTVEYSEQLVVNVASPTPTTTATASGVGMYTTQTHTVIMLYHLILSRDRHSWSDCRHYSWNSNW